MEWLVNLFHRKTYPCLIDGIKFKTNAELINHYRTVHSNDPVQPIQVSWK